MNTGDGAHHIMHHGTDRTLNTFVSLCLSPLYRITEFTGTLPSFNGLKDIYFMHLGENGFTGELPELTMPRLRQLNFSYNQLTGTIPSSIAQLLVLDTLDLSQQAQTFYNSTTRQRVTRGLTGQIPNTIGQVSFLQKLILSGNFLSGTLPVSLATLTYLGHMDLEDNRIGGQIPSSINILEQLGSVMLANNRLVSEGGT